MTDILLDDLIDFQLLGIISTFSNPFQLVYHLNVEQHTQFTRTNDLDIYINDELLVYYPTFLWEDPLQQRSYHLIKNLPLPEFNSDTKDMNKLFDMAPYLLPQHKNYNYILKINGWEFNAHTVHLPFGLSHAIQNIVQFDLTQIKTLDRLIF
ncbi:MULTISPECIES: IPExxxVDY family protein [Weeksella]|uniref:IPExxxVDY family protein n=1 Tax=Weeksella TaxID=1013 RepID=UPI0008A372BE|nr:MULTISPECIES: IPExxxVDY family protein [Weeksella]MDK7374068.1 IPExxxVDY family protein [Weeksella virosa]OFM82753.1 hypothetical protein HMPREF2660_03620 [Weeksella sp. HMSC059D05]